MGEIGDALSVILQKYFNKTWTATIVIILIFLGSLFGARLHLFTDNAYILTKKVTGVIKFIDCDESQAIPTSIEIMLNGKAVKRNGKLTIGSVVNIKIIAEDCFFMVFDINSQDSLTNILKSDDAKHIDKSFYIEQKVTVPTGSENILVICHRCMFDLKDVKDYIANRAADKGLSSPCEVTLPTGYYLDCFHYRVVE